MGETFSSRLLGFVVKYRIFKDAFAGCESLRTVYVEGDKIEWMGWVPEWVAVVKGSPPDGSRDILRCCTNCFLCMIKKSHL